MIIFVEMEKIKINFENMLCIYVKEIEDYFVEYRKI